MTWRQTAARRRPLLAGFGGLLCAAEREWFGSSALALLALLVSQLGFAVNVEGSLGESLCLGSKIICRQEGTRLLP